MSSLLFVEDRKSCVYGYKSGVGAHFSCIDARYFVDRNDRGVFVSVNTTDAGVSSQQARTSYRYGGHSASRSKATAAS